MPTLSSLLPRRRAARAATTALTVAGLVATAATAQAATGIDVSKWQHGSQINWSKVKRDGVSFTFIKATEGTNYKNSYYHDDQAATKRVGIYRGAYHFARPTKGSAARQARYFVRVVRNNGSFKARGDLPPVLDLESDGNLGVAGLRRWTRNWLETVENLTGRTPIIYASPYFWESELGDSKAFARYPLWVAHYTSGSPRVPGGWNHWTFWQRSSTGHVNGISGYVDINRFRGDRAALAKLARARVPQDGGGDPGTGTTPDPGGTPDTGTTPGTGTPGTGTPTPGTETPTTPAPETSEPQLATTVSLDLSRDTVFRGRTVTFSGTVASSTERPLMDKRVTLYRRVAGSATWSRLGTVHTDTSGGYALSYAVTGSAAFRVRFHGNTRWAAATSPRQSLTVRPRIRTRPTLGIERAARAGRTVKVYGHLRTSSGRAVAGKTMLVFQRLAGSRRWTLVARSSTLSPTGWYQAYVRQPRTATYRAVFRGGVAYTRAVSNQVTARSR